MAKISIIAAVANDRAIGKDNKLLWDIPEDLKHFKKITSGHPVIMGYNTFKSLPCILPNRTNIVLTPDDLEIEGVVVAHSLKEAYDIASSKDKEEIFVIGGGYVYSQAIMDTDRLYLTLVEGEYEADTYFPDYSEFKKIISEEKGESNGYKFKYLILER